MTVKTAVTASSAMAMMAARTPTRPSELDAVIDPTFATSMDITSGITVMRMRLTKIVPTGVATASTGPAADGRDVSVSPKMNPARRPIRTRVVSDTRECYRSALIGSTFVAREDGIAADSNATTPSSIATLAYTMGSL